MSSCRRLSWEGTGRILVMEMSCISRRPRQGTGCDTTLQPCKMSVRWGAGWKAHGVPLDYFLQLYVNLQLPPSKKLNFFKG